MKILFLTNVPSPYRVAFFNDLGKKCNLTVVFEKRTSDERGDAWGDLKIENFEGVFLKGKSINTDTAICFGVTKYVKDRTYDRIICSNVSSPTGMIAIQYMKLHKIPYWIEGDGGFAKSGKGFKERIKKYFISGAEGYFSTSLEHDKYYIKYGAKKGKIHRYPFTSLYNSDILRDLPIKEEKDKLRRALGLLEKKIIISVGRFTYQGGVGKGFDLLFEIARNLDNNIGIYIIADEPTEYFKNLKKQGGERLNNLHFIGFKQKEELFKFYMAADLFVLLSRGEAWGLVVNEAMANGLPVITTEKCIAGVELVKNGLNGFIVPSNDFEATLELIKGIIDDDEKLREMGEQGKKIIASYTIENMSDTHLKVLTEQE